MVHYIQTWASKGLEYFIRFEFQTWANLLG
jgi:hypothetical protein